MSQTQNTTNQIKAVSEVEALKKHFPHYFDKDGKFDFEKFRANLEQKEVNFSAESYRLEWLGKSYARLLASDAATTLLKPNSLHNSQQQNAQNLLLKGDNLEVLKHLAQAYYQKVKMIYIDPPYNTGSDGFVYQDDRKFTAKELQNLTGISEERAKRILDFTQSKSNSHSAWLTFMYPRLYLAKQLLKDDGVIFVSIDDNEVAQLRLLMDEIFGEENFVAEFVWKSSTAGGIRSKYVNNCHEYCLCYTKNINFLEIFYAPLSEKAVKQYNKIDDKGIYREKDFSWKNDSKGENQKYLIKCPDGELVKPQEGYLFRFIKETFEENLKLNNVIFKKTSTSPLIKENGEQANWNIYIKKYLGDAKGAPSSVIPENIGLSSLGTNRIQEIFKERIFQNSKSTEYIKYLTSIGSNPTDVILDFFAGSGTTGDAVMQLNAEDGGSRQFILVQLPEAIDKKKNKTAFDFVKNELKAEPTIFEITRERLLRAAKKINAGLDKKIEQLGSELPTDETKAEIAKLEAQKARNGFKIFETLPLWEDYDFEASGFDASQTLFDAGKLTEDDLQALLTTWKTYDGMALTEDLESVYLLDYQGFYGSDKLYLMHKDFTTEHLKALLEKIDADKNFNPASVICFGYHFESARLRELAENVKSYSNKKSIEIDFITRY
ncbi:site-specific DNA-methyltransferase [Hugenholtzia roseola]|uniref:site-specific DNA-methyltransferase n=1 Tax=Hugenholtzia roseola TaxID=1002 RepID=UPI000400B0C4|nr:site-specific DNA-methyltransferase [Hugenholtzia roseola]